MTEKTIDSVEDGLRENPRSGRDSRSRRLKGIDPMLDTSLDKIASLEGPLDTIVQPVKRGVGAPSKGWSSAKPRIVEGDVFSLDTFDTSTPKSKRMSRQRATRSSSQGQENEATEPPPQSEVLEEPCQQNSCKVLGGSQETVLPNLNVTTVVKQNTLSKWVCN